MHFAPRLRPIRIVLSWQLIATIALTACSVAASPADLTIEAKNKMPLRAQPFPMTAVRLLDGPFKHAQDLDHAYLLSLDTDRLLHTFRLNAGLRSTAQPLGGWEEPKGELRGHFLGHYLTACSLMYASTGDEKLKQKVTAVVAGLSPKPGPIASAYAPSAPKLPLYAVRSAGSAGSISLLFQALLLPLAFASEPSRLALRGGTHVPWSPPVHYVSQVFLPALRTIGLDADITLRRWG